MVLLIAGGFVVLGEVVSPLFSITFVELVASNLSIELNQALKIFFWLFIYGNSTFNNCLLSD